MPFAATWMGMGLVMSQTEKDRYAASLICKPKNYANELIYKAEIDSNTQKTSMVTKGESRVRGKVEKDKLGVYIYTPVYFKQINDTILLYIVITCNEKVDRYVEVNHFTGHLNLTPHHKLSILQS